MNLIKDRKDKKWKVKSESRELAVVLLSGGMDSCVCAAIANEDYRLAILHSSYGQRTGAKEEMSALAVVAHYNPEHTLHVNQTYMIDIGGSALTDHNIKVPRADIVAAQEGQIPPTYVPFRNAHFLSVAVSWAEVLGAKKIFVGAVEQDSSGYPDCRPSYYDAFNDLIKHGTKPETEIEIITPLIRLSKSQIVRRGTELNAPLQHTWSCYQSNMLACGECDSCVLRLRAFEKAGVVDPIQYVTRESVVPAS